MDYESLSLAELKKLAKGRRIKMYYTKSIRELRWLLAQPELPMNYKIEKLTIKELREEAKEKGVRGFWSLSRGQLVSLLYPNHSSLASQEDHQNQDNTHQNGSPHSHNSDQVGV